MPCVLPPVSGCAVLARTRNAALISASLPLRGRPAIPTSPVAPAWPAASDQKYSQNRLREARHCGRSSRRLCSHVCASASGRAVNLRGVPTVPCRSACVECGVQSCNVHGRIIIANSHIDDTVDAAREHQRLCTGGTARLSSDSECSYANELGPSRPHEAASHLERWKRKRARMADDWGTALLSKIRRSRLAQASTAIRLDGHESRTVVRLQAGRRSQDKRCQRNALDLPPIRPVWFPTRLPGRAS
jgi:hypothetical protein